MPTFGCQDWSCPLCTLINASDAEVCAACSRRRGVDNDPSSPDTGDGHVLGSDPDSELAVVVSQFENYLELAKMDDTDLITCLDHFECSVCLVYYDPGDGVTLKDCLHTFCRECLAMTIKHTTEAEVKCPFSDDDYVCDSILQEREIKALVSAEVYEEHLTRSISQAEHKIQDSFHCKTANCPGWCILDGNAVDFSCPVCDQINCIKCQTIHAGLTCLQYQEFKAGQNNDDASQLFVQNMLKRKQAMLCPGCRVMVMKQDGCDWLCCIYCKTEICWVTRGPRWGPKGTGDTSAGCQCKINGKRCHPMCGNCH